MLKSLDDLLPDQLYSTKDVAPFFPGPNEAKRVLMVRQLCQAGELTYVRAPGHGGQQTYWIPGKSVRAWRRNNEVKAA